jgi:hypothetical protein
MRGRKGTARRDREGTILEGIGILDRYCHDVHNFETGECPVCKEIKARRRVLTRA